MLFDRFMVVFEAASAKEYVKFNQAIKDFSSFYRKASVAQQGEYHARVARFMLEDA